ncbi:MAG: 6,7-dimethyl-8-ribityllumazine synthase [Bacteroidia bacterium]|jgi:6,7-dimethyl-8-ribityllumazine synthase|nr:6,7-dimethyl-8-ribityllumazine synthase [Bacteroidia bacterium]
MSTQYKNLSASTLTPDAYFKKLQIAIVVSEWNTAITGALKQGAFEFLINMGVKEKNIIIHEVPGSFELPLGAQWLAQNKHIDAVITLGCVIQGETKHFDFICDACAHGITQVGLQYNKPIVFGVLTTNTLEQAQERAGGKHGNKGIEAAETALKMLKLRREVTH